MDWQKKTDQDWWEMWQEAEETHWFSDEYETAKQENLVWMEGRKETDMSRKRMSKTAKWLVAAAAAVLLVPTGAYAAGKLYEIYVEKTGYKADVVIENSQETELILGNHEERLMKANHYKLVMDYMPDGLEYQEIHGKFRFNDNRSGITAEAWALGKNTTIEVLDIESAEKYNWGNREVVLLRRNYQYALESESRFDREAYVVFESENMLVHLYVSTTIADDELIKIVEGLRLEPAKYGELTDTDGPYITDAYTWEEMVEMRADVPIPIPDSAVKQEEGTGNTIVQVDRIASIGETYETYFATNMNDGGMIYETKVQITVENVEIKEDISGLEWTCFVEHLNENEIREYISEDGEILPYIRRIIETGDGILTPKETLVDEYSMQRKLVLVSLKYENVSNLDVYGEILIQPKCLPGELREKDGKLVFVEKEEDQFMNSKTWGDYVVYKDQPGSGETTNEDKGNASGYGSVALNAGETIEVTVGYLLDEDLTDELYLQLSAREMNGLEAKKILVPLINR